jgi:hypothetical protein
MKQLSCICVVLIGFVVSPGLKLQGAALAAHQQNAVQAFEPPLPNPNSPYPPASVAFEPPLPNPNSPYPPASVAFEPPLPNPNSPYPPGV